LVVLGAVLLASSIALGFTGLTDTYRHDVTVVDEQENPPAQELKDLTVSEQAVVLEATATAGTVWRSDPVGLRLQYPSGSESTRYRVSVENSQYILETAQKQRPVTMFVHGLRVSFVVAGLLLLLSGGISLLGVSLFPGMVLTEPFRTVQRTWAPVWAAIVLAPAGTFSLAYPLVLETYGPVPLNLFVAPFGLATVLCTALSLVFLKTVELPSGPFLLSVLNLPVLWAFVTGLVVGPSTGETSAILTVFLGIASLSVVVGFSLGWYTHRCLELRQSDYPNEPEYWRI
jgi:hypothetical protein